MINPKAYTLVATGPVTIDGKTGSKDVTYALVPPGLSALTGRGGSPHYRPGPWECTGATVSADILSLPVGTDAMCTITYRFDPVRPR